MTSPREGAPKGEKMTPGEIAERIADEFRDRPYGVVERIAAQIRQAVDAARAEAVANTTIELTQGITKIMDQTIASEIERLKKEAYEKGFAEARKIAEGREAEWMKKLDEVLFLLRPSEGGSK